MNKKVLVATSVYPKTENSYGGIYIHTRNKYYRKHGIDVTVLCFTADCDYIIDDIKVISYKTYQNIIFKWNIVVCHAPDRHIYLFLRKYANQFNKIVFFIHGNEVLKRNLYYKNQYNYVDNGSFLTKVKSEIRDEIKLVVLKDLFEKLAYKSIFVFVSKWMYKEFLKNINIKTDILTKRTKIIYNCVGDIFETEKYDFSCVKKYDFITIRGSLDSNKYGIDIVNNVAKNNPNFNFLVIGKGKYFNYYEKAKNLFWIEKNLTHKEIISYLQVSRCAFMPTRHDAQGVMMCEMATFGIPLITSDISVCHEVLEGFPNIFFIDNNKADFNIESILHKIVVHPKKIERFFKNETCGKEVQLLEELILN